MACDICPVCDPWPVTSALSVTRDLCFAVQASADQIVDAELGANYAEEVPVADLKKMTAARKKKG